MRRLRPALAAASLVLGASTAGLAATSTRAEAKQPLDVYNLRANAAPVEVAVKTAFAFVVYPDAQMPRATASSGGGQTTAIVSPADPGESVDALPGLFAPRVEQTNVCAQAAQQAPPPFSNIFKACAKPTASLEQMLTPVESVANPRVTYPYEHVQATYPDAHNPGQQTASFGPDPSVADPTGDFAVKAALGKVVAGDGVAIADAGAGAALTASPLGLSIGRVSSHVELHNLGDKVTSDSISEVDNVDINPQGISIPPIPSLTPPALHIGSIIGTAHSERSAGASQATGSHKLEFAGVTVAGQAAAIDDTGVHLLGQNLSLAPVIQALNTMFAAASGPNGSLKRVPVVGGQAIIPAGSMAGPQLSSVVSHNANEDTENVSGITMSLTGTLIAPAELGPSNLVATPVTYTISLATASSSAYGYSFPPLPAALPVPPPVESGPLGGDLTPSLSGLNAPPTTTPSNPRPRSSGKGGQAPGSPRLAMTLTGVEAVPKGLVLAVASLVEMLLLGALVASYRLRPQAPSGPSAADLDLA